MGQEMLPAIELNGVRKVFPLNQRPMDRLRETLGFRRPSHVLEHVALDRVDLIVERGETVGLLGVNGAGKSTLLQIITGTLQPTAGAAQTRGRISALLELGAGFNPAWTGRKNAEFQCVMQNVPADDIPRVMAAIEDFADIGYFFDEPAKTYSSGMYMRVAFAASVAVEPDILIVDEALAVGDVRFQNKCFRRFEEMQANGTTILFVTHAPDLVNRFCTRGILLNRGVVSFDGDAADATQAYFALTTASSNEDRQINDVAQDDLIHDGLLITDLNKPLANSTLEQRNYYNPKEMRTGSREVQIDDVFAQIAEGQEIDGPIASGSALRFFVRVSCQSNINVPEFGLILRSATNQLLMGLSSLSPQTAATPLFKEQTYEVRFDLSANLHTGTYFLDIGVADHDTGKRVVRDLRQSCVQFDVTREAEEFGLVYCNTQVEWRPVSLQPR